MGVGPSLLPLHLLPLQTPTHRSSVLRLDKESHSIRYLEVVVYAELNEHVHRRYIIM